MKKFLSTIAFAGVSVLALASCGPKADDDTSVDLAGTYNITLWGAEATNELFTKQIADFNTANAEAGIVVNATIQPVSESTAADSMINDVENGADIYCFAQDQFSRLVKAGALAKLGTAASKTVKEANDVGSIGAASSGEQLYAYPLTSDNGYFMYYDKSVVKADHVDDLAAIVKDCEAAKQLFCMENETSAWYIASWFFGAGCVSEWTTNDDGDFVDVNDTFNSTKGVIACKGMAQLVTSKYYYSSSDATNFAAANKAAVVISGNWDYANAKKALGDNLGVTDLPSYTVDGQSYHMGSFAGYKLMGVKPSADAKKAAVLNKLALYLTGEKCQMERFNDESLVWGPSNKNAQATDAVKAAPGLVALAAQNPYSTVQGNIAGTWWNVAKVIGDAVKAEQTEDAYKKALKDYDDALAKILKAQGYVAVGVNNGWDNLGENAGKMTKTAEGTYTIEIELSGDYLGFRIVKAGTWDNNHGYTEVTTGTELLNEEMADKSKNGDNNIVVKEAGTYVVTWDPATNAVTLAKK